MITGKTKVVGIMGAPVDHSLSPLIHNYWLKKYEVDGVYVPFPVKETFFEEAVRGMVASGVCGVNVTIPFKEKAFQLADDIAPDSQWMGAANVLVFSEKSSSIYGFSSDGQGFWDSLMALNMKLHGKKTLILGAGGAARSVGGYLCQKGMEVSFTNRGLVRAQVLAEELSAIGKAFVIDWQNWQDELERFDLLINCTSLGMGENTGHGFSPDLSQAQPYLVVADIVYTPQNTPLLLAAQERGLAHIGGLGMLVYQARPAFQSWFGITPEIDSTLWAMLAERV